ncbi:1-acyl-sn-glycerol-3-phosphate acyltransferases [Nitrosomonas sp. Nm51]|uniref:AMP-binding protein n=1 Tax=Nitrosomonas sp. Nm51 TaxID=133720 RepID=UPI0008CC6416|nr:AMP-binding protein [Nitrosomonas sp. Nm51]SER14920.1 1-acyl-sn-glycerol-3-phosphate acyltransferases [Nitrosomonas sp. Nm51]
MSAEERKAIELIEIIRGLGKELKLRPRSMDALSLDSCFDKDLGLDSLARVEFINRIERHFGVKLSDRVFAAVDTPRELLRAILNAGTVQQTQTDHTLEVLSLEPTVTAPHSAGTLVDMLDWHVQMHANRPHIRLYGDDEQETIITYGDLKAEAERIASGLQKLGVTTGDTVSLMLPTGRDYFLSFFGILIAGAIPVPIYPPLRLNQLEDHLLRHRSILQNCRAVALITVPEAKAVARLLKLQIETLQTVITPAELQVTQGRVLFPLLVPENIALLQYTSGSTGKPKGVTLTHANLLANIRAMGEHVEVDASDVFVSWLPLYHDMGLIGAWLGSLYFSALLIVMSPLTFLAKPERWLRALHRNRATLTAAPNFAYELCLKRIRDEDLEGLRLDSLRAVFNGAEAVMPSTLERFYARFGSYGLQREALMPVYGLAECSVGLSFPPVGRGPRVDKIDREYFMKTARAIPSEKDENALYFVSCGEPLSDHEIRIIDAAGHELPERRQGLLQFRGPSVTSGYYRNPEKNKALFDNGWVNSGDFAYIADGEVYITGRQKDIIVHAGRNIYPHEIEDAINEVDGVRRGCIAVFGSTSREIGTERLIVLAETRETASDSLERVRAEINNIVIMLTGAPPDDIVLAPPHCVLKTSSGKIRRAACREMYEQGSVTMPPRTPLLQVLRLLGVSLAPQLRRWKQSLEALSYAIYAWLALLFLAVPTWLLVLCIPRLSWRWKLIRLSTQTLAFITATPVSIKGLEHLHDRNTSCVLVSNHASYLDGLIMVHALPKPVSFIVKQELDRQFIAGNFLRRIGCEFVERFDMQKSAADAKKIAYAAAEGRSILFFPEGTFSRVPGLMPFRMGAFVAAAEAAIPVVPVIIRGTRSVLRFGSWLPHRSPISVTIGEAVYPNQLAKTNVWDTAVALRDFARSRMLAEVGEPDLAFDKTRR